MKKETKICPICGKEFISINKLCSRICFKKNHSITNKGKNLGKKSPFKGCKRDPEIGRKISKGLNDRMETLGYRYESTEPWQGKIVPQETRDKISESVSKMLLKAYADGSRKSTKGRDTWNKGLTGVVKRTEEYIKSISGDNSWHWRNGSSYEPYPLEFNKTLKEKVKKLYKNICVICGKRANGYMHIHHVDYDKNNNSIANLVPLCNKHHSKTNSNRKYWEKELTQIVHKKQVDFICRIDK